jgi:N-acetylneuraminic acid mutarotase
MMNDLWSYSLATSTWSKVNAANAPAARSTAETFVDPRDGYMYLFGGTTASSVYCRDVQRFNQSTNSWENLQTGGCGYSPPLYGTRGEFAAANVPGARMGGAMFYYAGYLWLFGGYGGRGTPTYYTSKVTRRRELTLN